MLQTLQNNILSINSNLNYSKYFIFTFKE